MNKTNEMEKFSVSKPKPEKMKPGKKAKPLE